MKLCFALLVVCLLVIPAAALEASKDVVATDVALSDGIVTLKDASGMEVKASTLINDVKFVPSLSTESDGVVVWGTDEKRLFIYDDPVVLFTYETIGNTLKETITLKEDRKLSFPVELSKDSRMIPWDNGRWKIISATSGSTIGGIVLEKPYGIDASGKRIEMQYQYYNGILLLDYNRTITTYVLSKDSKIVGKNITNLTPVYSQIAYPLIIDPTWTYVTDHWEQSAGGYNVFMWNATGTTTWTVPEGVTSLEYLVVGGGGGASPGGGGGAGGYRSSVYGESSGGGASAESAMTVAGGNILTIVVGSGGNGATGYATAGTNGGATAIKNDTLSLNITSIGGGAGGRYSSCTPAAQPGGSGGGGAGTQEGGNLNCPGADGAANQGYGGGDGYYLNYHGAGGGGAGAAGVDATSDGGGNGGAGVSSTIAGETLYYAGGGGGGVYVGTVLGDGGSGVGGHGGGGGMGNPTSGVAGTGSGGGGNGGPELSGACGAGGSGVVVVRYSTAFIASFSANVTSGYTSVPVKFTDSSGGAVTWNWSYTGYGFNTTSGIFSTVQHPTAVFTRGNYLISLNVTNATGGFDVSDQITWINVSMPASGWTDATGCWTATQAMGDGNTYQIIKWNATGTNTFAVPGTSISAEYLVIGGGGGGGAYGGSGGGAGGVLSGSGLTMSGTETIIVGPGGHTMYNVEDGNGQNSSLTNDGATIEAMGGGRGTLGGGDSNPPHVGSGGSGGGGGSTTAHKEPGTGVAGQGYRGGGSQGESGKYGSGGGGGASEVGFNGTTTSGGGNGGNGLPFSISGMTITYAGGGGGCGGDSPGSGGTGGGGTAATYSGSTVTVSGTGGTNELGGGGGGGASTSNASYGQIGGSGVVIIRYVLPSAPLASFSYTPQNGTAPLTVAFTDTSTETPTSWSWSATNIEGNNTAFVFNTTQNPVHTFTVGNYSIKLNATNAYGSNVSTQVSYVTAFLPPVAAFTSNVTCGLVPFTAQFNDTSGYATASAWSWNFNNGNTSTSQNPEILYSGTGYFGVNFSVTTPNGTSWSNVSSYMLARPAGDTCVMPSAATVTEEGMKALPSSVKLNPDIIPIIFTIIPFACLGYIFRKRGEGESNSLWSNLIASGVGAVVAGMVVLWLIGGGIGSVPVTLENVSYEIPSSMSVSDAIAIQDAATSQASTIGHGGDGMFIATAMSTAERTSPMSVMVRTYDTVTVKYQDGGLMFLYLLLCTVLVALFGWSIIAMRNQLQEQEYYEENDMEKYGG